MTIGFCAFALVALAGCQRTEVTTETYVNKADAKQVLKLESQPSLKLDLIGRFHGVESAGVYTLKNDKGTSSGSYTYVLDDAKKTRQYIFHPKQGERWVGRVESKGSFTDDKGSVWRIQQFKTEEQLSTGNGQAEGTKKVLFKVGG